MNWKEYSAAIVKFDRTADWPPERRCVHYVLGILSDFDELAEALTNNDRPNIIEELGDASWYVTRLCDLARVTELSEFDFTVEAAPWRYGALADIAKRWFVGGKTPSEAALRELCKSTLDVLSRIAVAHNIDMADVYDRNIDKLMLRSASNTKKYEETLDESARDRAGERAIMEQQNLNLN